MDASTDWRVTVRNNAIAGALAGLTADLIFYPLDTIKTRLQASVRGAFLPGGGGGGGGGGGKIKNAIHSGSNNASITTTATSTSTTAAVASAATTTTRKNLYAGVGYNLIGGIPAAATWWVVYESTKKFLHTVGEETNPSSSSASSSSSSSSFSRINNALASANAAWITCAVRNPFEVVKAQRQAGLHASGNAVIKSILASPKGIRGFYAGAGSSLARDMPFDVIQFSVYEELKQQLGLQDEQQQQKQQQQQQQLEETKVDKAGWGGGGFFNFLKIALSSAFSGAIAAGVTTPLDVVRTRLQTMAGNKNSTIVVATPPPVYKGTVHALVSIYRTEGMKALFSGIKPRVAYLSLGSIVFIGTVEGVKKQLPSK